VVVIETERLLLRPMTVEDLDHVLALHSEPAIIEFLGPTTAEAARERLEASGLEWRERGYGRMAAIDWGFRNFPLSYVTAMIRPDNSRSLGVARRLGLKPIRDDFQFGVPVIVHAISREQWGAPRRPDEVEATGGNPREAQIGRRMTTWGPICGSSNSSEVT
jgi:RimJ/RimL family protein N-acetyltransferase